VKYIIDNLGGVPEMPIYEYKCRKCGKVYEMFQGITEPAATSCKFCKGSVNKLISRSSFHLKGSGWYVTDYGGKKPEAKETNAIESPASSTPEPEKSVASPVTQTEE
jgi:putative FmdB family regulatory protein